MRIIDGQIGQRRKDRLRVKVQVNPFKVNYNRRRSVIGHGKLFNQQADKLLLSVRLALEECGLVEVIRSHYTGCEM